MVTEIRTAAAGGRESGRGLQGEKEMSEVMGILCKDTDWAAGYTFVTILELYT